jgi:predicted HAD superfamily Cof-like phosphohydrolase
VINNYTEKLIEFHKALFAKTGFWPADVDQKFIPGNPTARARDYLINEEVIELSDILLDIDEDTSKAHLLKELCDVLYVIHGTVATLGLSEVIDEAFDRVHQNNMLKITNGIVNSETGKFTKAPDHPKVYLKDLTGEEENALQRCGS